jgi:2-(3-amino-3-carboxypropyl)histidine synthase
MDNLLINAEYNKEIKLDEYTLNYLKKFRTIAVYSAVQFSNKLQTILDQLKEFNIITSKPQRTNGTHQILGCDLSYENLNLNEKPDAFLYVGDGIFHPRALALSQKEETEFKEIIRFNPMENKHEILNLNDIQKILKKSKANLLKFLHADTIGVVITTKPGQQQFQPSKLLEEKYKDKRFYYFVDNNIDFSNFENFQFIESWINTACPRLGFDDAANSEFPIINLTEALNAEKILSQKSFLTS